VPFSHGFGVVIDLKDDGEDARLQFGEKIVI